MGRCGRSSVLLAVVSTSETGFSPLERARRDVLTRLAPVLPLVTDLGERFAAAGHSLALVGGPVRDALLGRPSPDLDFATDARPEQTEPILRRWGTAHWDVGRDFGTIGAQLGPVTVEVTTYRSDVYDRESRKPEVSYGDTLDGDLARRDFTVNAMALRLPGLELVDQHGGLADLAARMLRTPATPESSFGDDPLRMLRAARFAAQLGMWVAPEVRTAMAAMASRLDIISAERIHDELVKLILSPDPVRGLRLLVDTGIASIVMPELPALQLEVDEHHRHKDVYEHTLTVLEQAMALETGPEGEVPEPDLVLRLAALLHDIGKPATRRYEAGGGVSFHHHEVVGAKLTAKRLKALRFESATVKDVARLVELHLRFHGYGDGAWTDAAVRRYVVDAGPLLSRLHRLTRSDSTTRNARRATQLSAAYDDLEARIARLADEEGLAAVRPDLDGNEIMAALGIGPGREVGAAYRHLLELRLDRGPLPKDEALAELHHWWSTRTP
jgi:poly(A) polymerase